MKISPNICRELLIKNGYVMALFAEGNKRRRNLSRKWEIAWLTSHSTEESSTLKMFLSLFFCKIIIKWFNSNLFISKSWHFNSTINKKRQQLRLKLKSFFLLLSLSLSFFSLANSLSFTLCLCRLFMMRKWLFRKSRVNGTEENRKKDCEFKWINFLAFCLFLISSLALEFRSFRNFFVLSHKRHGISIHWCHQPKWVNRKLKKYCRS